MYRLGDIFLLKKYIPGLIVKLCMCWKKYKEKKTKTKNQKNQPTKKTQNTKPL